MRLDDLEKIAKAQPDGESLLALIEHVRATPGSQPLRRSVEGYADALARQRDAYEALVSEIDDKHPELPKKLRVRSGGDVIVESFDNADGVLKALSAGPSIKP